MGDASIWGLALAERGGPSRRVRSSLLLATSQALRERNDALDVPLLVGGVAKFQFRDRWFVLNFCLAATGSWHARCLA